MAALISHTLGFQAYPTSTEITAMGTRKAATRRIPVQVLVIHRVPAHHAYRESRQVGQHQGQQQQQQSESPVLPQFVPGETLDGKI